MSISGCTAAALQSFPRDEAARRVSRRGPGSVQFAALLAVSWLAVVVLAVPFVADRYMQSSEAAAAEGRIGDSVAHALKASRLEPWSPAPHLQLAVIAQSLGRYQRSIAEYSRAAELEPENWQPPYLKAIAEFERGNIVSAADEAEAAFRLNPRSERTRSLWVLLTALAQ
jgi:tetratricopeptide (TPR) repeat protein